MNSYLTCKSKLSILIVDDEEEICELIESALSATEWFSSIITASNYIIDSQKKYNQIFYIVIIDNILPDKKGLNLIRLIKSSLKKQKPKIIFMSAGFNPDHITKAAQLGVGHILVKPFTLDKLYTIVSQILKIKG